MGGEGLTTFLSGIGALFTQSVGWMIDLAEQISSSPEMSVFVFGFAAVGFVFGLFRRGIHS